MNWMCSASFGDGSLGSNRQQRAVPHKSQAPSAPTPPLLEMAGVSSGASSGAKAQAGEIAGGLAAEREVEAAALAAFASTPPLSLIEQRDPTTIPTPEDLPQNSVLQIHGLTQEDPNKLAQEMLAGLDPFLAVLSDWALQAATLPDHPAAFFKIFDRLVDGLVDFSEVIVETYQVLQFEKTSVFIALEAELLATVKQLLAQFQEQASPVALASLMAPKLVDHLAQWRALPLFAPKPR